MNILIESSAFYPSVGGLEMMSRELAEAWQERGHRVRIMTRTPLGGAPALDALDVRRRPRLGRVCALMRWCHVLVQHRVNLRTLGPAVLLGAPIVFMHPAILTPKPGQIGARKALMRLATHLGHNIVNSAAVAESVPGPKTRIPNTYRPAFRNVATDERDTERAGLLFVGRLVPVKGGDIALEALAQLHAQGQRHSLTICGDGSERAALERQARALGLEGHVRFEGWTTPEALKAHYARAQATLVPSRREPFGIVALEAIACGCPVVAARTGGLPEAAGPCGLFFAPGDAGELARQVRRACRPAVRERLMAQAPEHLARHDIDRIVERYLEVLRSAAARS